ncbi:MED7 [Cordylochernes scorpioides]|uniref:Mediator of RNA polymerase II transcription subunit 7 n=1 Tax=Cordylochernes scorpioides TaxID=51811 RepID=A0ABY6K1P9_9ARAC|nr:MED7 [Cordylochernes scorpioides]
MAAPPPPATISSLPMPPVQFINLYTEENMAKGLAPPPPRPIQDSYTMFGNQFHADDVIIRPLELQGIRRLYPQNYDHKKELKKLNHSILVNYLDMLDILIRCPDTTKREEKKEDLNLLYIHIHHLINEFRPHQARETLRVMMEIQKRQKVETRERFQKHLEKVLELIQNAQNSLLPDTIDLNCGTGPAEKQGLENAVDSSASKVSDCHSLDKLMCDIVDSL